MYLRRMLGSAGLALAVVAAPVVGPATAAHAAFPPHTITPQFDLVIHDEDDFPLTDQVQRFLLPAEKAVVTSAQKRVWTFTKCLDEVKVTTTFTVNLDAAGVVRTKTDVSLFEGATCATTDLDGSGVKNGHSNGVGTTTLPVFQVNNTAEYDASDILAGDCDFGKLTVKFTDSV
jgi:hypothetical protein